MSSAPSVEKETIVGENSAQKLHYRRMYIIKTSTHISKLFVLEVNLHLFSLLRSGTNFTSQAS